jgi:UDP:flavonoid glycosyltransferase YjiC (YdhE family)
MVKSVYEGWLAPVQKKFVGFVEETGAATPTKNFFDLMIVAPDRFLQMCTPSAEYPRSDAPASIRFAGGLPKGKRAGFTEKPSWWGQIVNPGGKTVVAVSQGSVALNYSDLTIPAIEAFKDREDIILVVALGKKGASLDADVPVGKNTFVSDFIPFDELMPLCSVFITNGGYGAFQHSLSNGTPLVVAGATEDKPEVAARAEWAGVGINLRTGNPSPEAISTAVDEILKNPKYKQRSKELEAEMATFDPMEAVARNIDELAAGLK